MSPSRELATVTAAICTPVAALGVLVVGLPAILGAAIAATVLLSIAGFMRWMDGPQ